VQTRISNAGAPVQRLESLDVLDLVEGAVERAHIVGVGAGRHDPGVRRLKSDFCTSAHVFASGLLKAALRSRPLPPATLRRYLAGFRILI
jgi:hypothetical protein